MYKTKELPTLITKEIIKQRMSVLTLNPEMDDERLIKLPKEIISLIVEKWMKGDLCFHLDISSVLWKMNGEKKEFLQSLKNDSMEFQKVLPKLFEQQMKLKKLLN
jgi:hypothetical protein